MSTESLKRAREELEVTAADASAAILDYQASLREEERMRRDIDAAQARVGAMLKQEASLADRLVIDAAAVRATHGRHTAAWATYTALMAAQP
jgi:hypothetical protein